MALLHALRATRAILTLGPIRSVLAFVAERAVAPIALATLDVLGAPLHLAATTAVVPLGPIRPFRPVGAVDERTLESLAAIATVRAVALALRPIVALRPVVARPIFALRPVVTRR